MTLTVTHAGSMDAARESISGDEFVIVITGPRAEVIAAAKRTLMDDVEIRVLQEDEQ